MNDSFPFEKISRCPLFKALDTDKLYKLFQDIPWSLKKYPSGSLIAFRGDSLEHLMLLIEGRISAEITSFKGKVLKVETLSAPCTIAGPMLFSDESLLPVQLTAETDVEILRISREHTLALLSRDKDILNKFLTDSGNKISFLSEKIHLYQFHSIRQKLAVYILDLKQKQKGNSLVLPLKIETMAELFSVTRPSLSRSLSELVDQGLLSRKGKNLEILDEDELRLLLEEG